MSYSELETALMKGAVELEIEHCLGLVTTRSVAMAFKKYVEPLTLPTADRDAIREAVAQQEQYLLSRCGSENGIKPKEIEGSFHVITAALALLGEG